MLRRLLEGIAAATPGQCAVCRAWPAQPVCEVCVAQFAQPRSRCLRCALPLPPLPLAPPGPLQAGGESCIQCLRAPPPLDACRAAVSYGYPWSFLIARYKFHGQPGWADTFAMLMRSTPWVEPALDQAALVLPMPLSAARLAERGFNQALELARRLAPGKTNSALLLRVRDTAPQTELDRRDRLLNVMNAFAVDPLRAAELRGREIVLVDDVMTSGASLFSAADTLRRAGAGRITALVLARTDAPD